MMSENNLIFIQNYTGFQQYNLPSCAVDAMALAYLSKVGAISPLPYLISSIVRDTLTNIGFQLSDRSYLQSDKHHYFHLKIKTAISVATIIIQIPLYFAVATLSFNVQAVALGILLCAFFIANTLSKRKLDAISSAKNEAIEKDLQNYLSKEDLELKISHKPTNHDYNLSDDSHTEKNEFMQGNNEDYSSENVNLLSHNDSDDNDSDDNDSDDNDVALFKTME